MRVVPRSTRTGRETLVDPARGASATTSGPPYHWAGGKSQRGPNLCPSGPEEVTTD
jgi:hypothetical protein